MQTKLIYIADDDHAIRHALKAFLQNAGHTVEDFETGAALFERFVAHPPHLVVLDVVMPGSSGFAVLRDIRKTSAVPVILLTARDSDLDYQTAMDLGADFYYTKPTSPMEIVAKIRDIFAGSDGGA